MFRLGIGRVNDKVTLFVWKFDNVAVSYKIYRKLGSNGIETVIGTVNGDLSVYKDIIAYLHLKVDWHYAVGAVLADNSEIKSKYVCEGYADSDIVDMLQMMLNMKEIQNFRLSSRLVTERAIGEFNGLNNTYTFSNVYEKNSLVVLLNGQELIEGEDYIDLGDSIRMILITPVATDDLIGKYYVDI